MTPSSRAPAGRSGPGLVVMGCAGEDTASLGEAVETLRRDGLEVELCPDLDQDPKHLSEVIDRHEGRGLYVLCRSPALGRERVEELREILLARHVPFARTLTVAVGGRGALADRIRSGLRRASARSSGPNQAFPLTNATEDEEPTLVGKRDGVSEPLELVPSQPLPLPPRPAPVTPGPALLDASPSAGVPTIAPDEPTPPDISVVAAVDAELLTEDTNASWNSVSVASLDLSDLDEGHTGPARMPSVDNTTVGRPPALITGDTVIGPAPALITGQTLQGEKLPRALRDAADRFAQAAAPPSPPMGTPAAMPPRASTLPASPLPPAPPMAPGPAMPPTPSAPLRIAAPSLPPGRAEASMASASVSLGDARVSSGAGKALPWVLGVVALALLALVVGLWISSDRATPVVADGSDAEPDDAPSSAEATPEPTPTPDDAEANPAPAEPVVYPVVVALERRKARALDVLIIATAWGKPSDYPSAAAYCAALDVEGVRGWRLPHVGELRSLAQANMIARGMFWSSTAADTFGDERMAWNARRGYAAPHSDDAVAVCVRGEASGS